ncbi:MAG: hypothetical protein IT449_05060 [Phycisphaerales bacterium]|nr:hypothetical protein [Phycisphaerales bacterium]
MEPTAQLAPGVEQSTVGDNTNVLTEEDVYCPACGYNLRALVSDRCPECALDVAFIKSAESLLPWVHRARVGRLRAYLVTVWMVVFRTQRFCLEMSRPVGERDARAFRRITVLLAFLPFPLLTLALAMLRPDGFDAVLHFGGPGYLAVMHAAVLAAILSVTGVPYYVIRHKEVDLARQLRAAALSLYCCAPLSIMGAAVVFAVGGVAASRLANRDWDLALYSVALGIFVVLMVIVLFDVQRVIWWMLRETGSALAVNVKLCLFWCLSVFLSLVAFPAAAAYGVILYYSLRA